MPMRFLAILIFVAMVAAVSALWIQQEQREPRVVSGFVEAHQIRVGSRLGGRVREVLVEEGDWVQPGQILVTLEPFDLLERLREAESTATAAKSEYEKLRQGFRDEEKNQALALADQARAAYDEAKAGPREQEIKEAEKHLELARAELQLLEVTFQRVETLAGKNAAARSEYDEAFTKRSVAARNVEVREARLALLREGTRKEQLARAEAHYRAAKAEQTLRERGYRTEDIAAANAKWDAAQERVKALKQQLAELEIRAPSASLKAAVVEAIQLRPGDLIAPNAPVLSLLDASRMWVRAYVPESSHGLVQRGQILNVAIDSFPNVRFEGKVIYMAREAEFTPSNVQTPEERSKQVFRVKVELLENSSVGLEKLHPGMAADVYLEETN